MPERWVVNASPIILLSKIEYHHLLIRLSDQIVVPEAVAEEIRNGSAGDPARRFLDSRGFHVVAEPPEPDILAWDLGAGETAVLSHARTNPGWRVVIDVGMARRCARSFSIPVIGTPGVIIRARRAGLIEAAVPVLKALLAYDYRIDEEVIRLALQNTVGEIWD